MKNTPLTSSEIANLWSQYINDSLSICVIKHGLQVMEDKEIRSIYEQALQLSIHHIETVSKILKQENLAVPVGFTDEDVHVEAPRLFSDPFLLYYLYTMTIHGLSGYNLAIATSTRKDIRQHFIQSNTTATELYDRITDVLLSKGIYSRPPFIPYDHVDFVKSHNFITGWFGERRPLNAIEINHIFFNLKKSAMAKVIAMGFSQVARDVEVVNFLINAADIAQKHIEIFTSVLQVDDLPSPTQWDSDVTTSTVSPFSDKLMMYLLGFLFQTSVAYYGTALATSMRPDIATHYTRIIAEDLKEGKDWANIMIKNGWLEQVPQAPDRIAIAKEKK